VTALALRAAQVARAPLPASLRLAVLVVCTVPAFWFSLGALAGQWRYETPLGDLVLVPLLALAALAAACRRHPYVTLLRLGWFDLLLGGALIAAALALLATGPTIWSKYFWAMRIDMLALPLFVAGGVLLLFGARAIVPFAFPVFSLFLAWPLPYQAVLERELAGFTQLTSGAVVTLAPRLGLGKALPGSDGAFALAHGPHKFTLSIGSACSGVNSLLGFLLLAAFALFFLEGLPARRLAWLAVGAVLVWVANILRILALFALGQGFGERAAIAVLHPVAGLVALNLAVACLLRLMPRFHLFWRELEPVHADTPLAQPAPPDHRASASRLVGRIGLLLAATAVIALADGQLAVAARGLTNDGVPTIASFASRPSAAPGWTVRKSEKIGWATPYFGKHSSWTRYILRPARPSHDAFTVWLDAVRSPDLGALDAYTLAHCYAFHGFTVEAARHITLGNGVVGQSFVYGTGDAEWHAVSWEWPVRVGSGTEHERIVLLAASPARPRQRETGSVHGVTRAVLWLLDFREPRADPNPALTRALTGVAAGIVAKRVGAAR
jgi:exosortase/archaeosortase family protein